MSKETRFLSRLLGLYCLIVALAMLTRRQATLATVAALLQDRPLMYLLGVCGRGPEPSARVAAAARLRQPPQGYLFSTTARTGCVS